MEQTPLLTADAESLRPVVLEVFGTTDLMWEQKNFWNFWPKSKSSLNGGNDGKESVGNDKGVVRHLKFLLLEKHWGVKVSGGSFCPQAWKAVAKLFLTYTSTQRSSVACLYSQSQSFWQRLKRDRTHWSGHRPGQLMAGVSFCCSDWVLSDIEFLSFNLRWLWKFTNQNVKCYSKYNVGWPENTLEGLINTNQHS